MLCMNIISVAAVSSLDDFSQAQHLVCLFAATWLPNGAVTNTLCCRPLKLFSIARNFYVRLVEMVRGQLSEDEEKMQQNWLLYKGRVPTAV